MHESDYNSLRHGNQYAGQIMLRRVPLDRGGYTRSGRYFGVGAPLFEYEADDGLPGGVYFNGYVRAADREAAKAKLRAMFPHATGLGGPRRAKRAGAKPNARRAPPGSWEKHARPAPGARRTRHADPKRNAHPDADPNYAAQYSRGWNKGVADMKGDQAYAADLADGIFDGTVGKLDLFGGYDLMPSPAFRRGWKDAVFEVANHGSATILR